MNWHPCWFTAGISFLLTALILSSSFRRNRRPIPGFTRQGNRSEASFASEGKPSGGQSGPSLTRSRFPVDTPMIRRNQELMEFPNPAMPNVLALVEHFGRAGWLKTGLLEDATLLACASSQLRLWKSSAAHDSSRLSSEIQRAHPSFPNESKESFSPEAEWKGVDTFYLEVFQDRFRTRYGITDPDFAMELMRIDFGNPFPDFRTWEAPRR